MVNVLYLPGLLGSDLGYDTGAGPPPQPVWLDAFALATGGAVYLQLGPDGASPGPLAEGIDLYATSIFAPVYTPLGLFLLAQGYNLLAVPYDWRKSVITSAAAVLAATQQAFLGEPFYVVAHSQGGLVARAMWKQMFERGADAQLLRIVTICTPQYGSMEPVRFYCRLPKFYTAIVTATAWPPTVLSDAGPAYIDAVVATWPGLFELMPFLAEGPLAKIDPALARRLWTAGYYAGGNPYLTQQMLDTALQSQEYLLDAIPPGRLTSIVGTGVLTAILPAQKGSPLLDSGYEYSLAGDGTVSVASATLPGVPQIQFVGDHVTLLLRPDVWAVLPFLLTGGL